MATTKRRGGQHITSKALFIKACYMRQHIIGKYTRFRAKHRWASELLPVSYILL